MRSLISLLFVTVITSSIYQIAQGQETDIIAPIIEADTLITADSVSSKKPKKQKKVKYYNPNHSPKKAAFLSLAFPGTGQIYNRKYWKLPIVYGGMGASLYFVITNSQSLRRNNNLLADAYINNPDNVTAITANRDIARRNVEVSSIVFGAVYLANILDAIVDAHLMNFDVSDDLSLQINPQILTVNNEVIPALGLNLRL